MTRSVPFKGGSPFRAFIGIDQTGALDSGGIPKKLPCAVILKRGDHTEAFINLRLARLTREELNAQIPDATKGSLIVVDSVLGVPSRNTTDLPLRKLFELAKRFRSDGAQYGASVAHAFFLRKVLKIKNTSPLEVPRRHAEILAKANTVFLREPFQRNIGCGTYRVWRDLAEDTSWFTLWPLEPISWDKKARKSVLCEGYPSLYWRKFIKAKRGDCAALIENLKSNGVTSTFVSGQTFRSVDDMDALLLAVYGYVHWMDLLCRDALPQKARKREGWILGLPPKI